ncbi:MAG: hypothetical protein V4443_09135 [Pseudomonadota bacterium]
MSLEPTNLNIPLERKDRLGYWVIAGCALFTGATALVNVDFSIVFFSSCVVGLPVLWFAIISSKGRKNFSSWGDPGLVAFYAVLFCYIAIAKTVLVPALQAAIRHALA